MGQPPWSDVRRSDDQTKPLVNTVATQGLKRDSWNGTVRAALPAVRLRQLDSH
jgi:hypothetical protein